jgi:L-alanine-DL-glutamate epimerase-like enolase superfamily enzyme
MKEVITSYELWKLELPAGRVIGDCGCHYSAFDTIALGLKTNEGHVGWGIGDTVSGGVFTKPAPWITPMPALEDLQCNFERDFWSSLEGRSPFGLRMQRPTLFTGYSYFAMAVRLALWDLMAKIVGLPLYQFLGGAPGRNRVRAYASGLDFPLSEQDAIEKFKDFIGRGFKAVKVKVGAPNRDRDLERLRVVRECVGDNVEIAIDANEAWTCDEAINRIRYFQQNGVRLSYVEDPMSRDDMEGLARLNASVDLDIIGHDYIVDSKTLRRFVEHKSFNRIRVQADYDYALDCAEIAQQYGTPLIFANSILELSVHAAAAMPHVDRMEFSDLGWNLLPQNPIRFEDGYGIAPDTPGHGLDPSPEALERFKKPGMSEPPRFVTVAED